MPVELVLAVREGWKQTDNQRFGDCLEVRFINVEDGKILFRYAPNLRDEPFWNEMFSQLKVYDELHKAIFSLVQRIEGDRFLSMGSCQKT